MKNMKKIHITIIMIAVFLCACGKNQEPGKYTIRTESGKTESFDFDSEFIPDRIKLKNVIGSTCFSALGYDNEEKCLVVEFKESGSRYAYYDVPETVWSDLKSAESKGGYYNDEIKGKYVCKKLTD